MIQDAGCRVQLLHRLRALLDRDRRTDLLTVHRVHVRVHHEQVLRLRT
jgi:hypothetical protein